MENNKKKTCGNCRHYAQHYFKWGIRYRTSGCGSCLNRNNKSISKKKQMCFDSCGFWEDIAIIKKERKESVKEILKKMSKSLNEIALILKEDEKTE